MGGGTNHNVDGESERLANAWYVDDSILYAKSLPELSKYLHDPNVVRRSGTSGSALEWVQDETLDNMFRLRAFFYHNQS